jgi:hypothetical protein
MFGLQFQKKKGIPRILLYWFIMVSRKQSFDCWIEGNWVVKVYKKIRNRHRYGAGYSCRHLHQAAKTGWTALVALDLVAIVCLPC